MRHMSNIIQLYRIVRGSVFIAILRHFAHILRFKYIVYFFVTLKIYIYIYSIYLILYDKEYIVYTIVTRRVGGNCENVKTVLYEGVDLESNVMSTYKFELVTIHLNYIRPNTLSHFTLRHNTISNHYNKLT